MTQELPPVEPSAPQGARLVDDPVRVGAVRFLNTAPLIEGLDKARGVEVVPAAPSRLIDLLLERRVDVALVSAIDFQRSPEPLTVLPVGMIGCDGPTMTVRLYSTAPVERVTRVHADTESHTSIALLRVLLRQMFDTDPEIVDFDARERVERAGAGSAAIEWPEAVLMIGDKVVTDSPPAIRYPHQLDLGEAWKHRTGLPFVYAAWACRTSDESSDRVRIAARALQRQRLHNRTRLDWVIARRAPERGWPIDLAQRYLHDLLRFDLGQREREAMERFFDEAASAGVLESRRPVRWWSDAPVEAGVSACPA